MAFKIVEKAERKVETAEEKDDKFAKASQIPACFFELLRSSVANAKRGHKTHRYSGGGSEQHHGWFGLQVRTVSQQTRKQ
jgi:hypothetical protein